MTQANPATPEEADYWEGWDERQANMVSDEDRERIFMDEVLGTPAPENEPAKNLALRLRLREDLKDMEAQGIMPMPVD